MRKITTHRVGKINEAIGISVHGDEPGVFGAYTDYEIYINQGDHPQKYAALKFPDALSTKGTPVIGITNESLLAIIIDRLEGFCGSEHPPYEYGEALRNCRQAMHWLHFRTQNRIDRKVDGTTKP